jgi:DNA adenine methylase
MPNLLFSYPGSKAVVARWHATMFPPTKRYVTVFGGTAAELMYRPPSGVEVYNDLDCYIHNVFSVLRDWKKCEELKRLLLTTPDGRRQFLECKEAMDDPNPVRRAWACLVVANSGDVRRVFPQRNWWNAKHRLYHLPEHVDWWRDRLSKVKLECRPWQSVVDYYDGEDTFFYLDPPYHPRARKSNSPLYRHELSADEHTNLLLRLQDCQSKVMICGYRDPLYDLLLSDWVRREAGTICRMGDKSHRTEAVWLNFEPPFAIEEGCPEEFDESVADDIPHKECPFCERRFPI